MNSNKLINLALACKKILNGEVVAVPTETVYGLAAHINHENAVRKIYSIKNRPISHPLIVHVASQNDIYNFCQQIPDYVQELVNKFWPGPLTFILKKAAAIPYYVTGGQDTVAIRMPDHELTLELIAKLGCPIVAPSANKFTGISPTRPEHVIAEFNGMVDVLDGGICRNGIESTIIDCTEQNSYKILRPGFITVSEINCVLNANHYTLQCIDKHSTNLRYPGAHKKHYAPQKPLFTFKTDLDLAELLKKFKNAFVIYHSDYLDTKLINAYKMAPDAYNFGRDLYHALRDADNSVNDIIAIEEPPHDGEQWEAIWDRLNKAIYHPISED